MSETHESMGEWADDMIDRRRSYAEAAAMADQVDARPPDIEVARHTVADLQSRAARIKDALRPLNAVVDDDLSRGAIPAQQVSREPGVALSGTMALPLCSTGAQGARRSK